VDDDVVGCIGIVTIGIPGGAGPGEIRVFVRGVYELFMAYTDEPTAIGHQVKVLRSRGRRAVDVTWIPRDS
jgi:hypothetical protein